MKISRLILSAVLWAIILVIISLVFNCNAQAEEEQLIFSPPVFQIEAGVNRIDVCLEILEDGTVEMTPGECH